MKAAVFYGTRDIRVEEVETPEVGENDVLVRVKACGVCGSDVHSYKNAKYIEMPKNAILGHEISGEVSKIGSNVNQVSVGDRVVVEPLIGCGRCNFCMTGQYHLCKGLKHIGWQYKGGFAEYVSVPQEKVYKLPDDVPYEEAALLDGFAVAVHAIHRVNPDISDEVVIFGAGTIGLSILQLIKVSGARKIVVVDLNDKMREVSKALGADIFVNPKKEDLLKIINNLTNSVGANVVFESVGGNASTMSDAVKIVKPGGTIGAIGSFVKCPEFDFSLFHDKEINLLSVWSFSKWKEIPEMEIALNLLAEGRINAKSLITHKFSLDDINEAFSTAENKIETGAIKVLVVL